MTMDVKHVKDWPFLLKSDLQFVMGVKYWYLIQLGV